MLRICTRTDLATRVACGVVGGFMIVCGASAALAQTAQKPVKTAQGPAVPPEVVPGPAAAPRPGETAPACDTTCVRRNADPAAQACVPLVEAKAAVDYDWLSRPFGGMFTQAEQPGADGIVRYRGDSIRVLVQNQWLRHAYECSWDPAKGRIVAVQLRPGRLVPPAAIAQLTGSPLAQPSTSQPAQAKTPAQAQQMIREALQRAAGAAPAGPPAAKPKPRPRWGEPSPIAIQQAHLRSASIDSPVRIGQASRSPAAKRGERSRDMREPAAPNQ